MNINECEIGMKVRAEKDIDFGKVKAGDILIIKGLDKDNTGNCKGYLYFDETGGIGICVDCFSKIN